MNRLHNDAIAMTVGSWDVKGDGPDYPNDYMHCELLHDAMGKQSGFVAKVNQRNQRPTNNKFPSSIWRLRNEMDTGGIIVALKNSMNPATGDITSGWFIMSAKQVGDIGRRNVITTYLDDKDSLPFVAVDPERTRTVKGTPAAAQKIFTFNPKYSMPVEKESQADSLAERYMHAANLPRTERHWSAGVGGLMFRRMKIDGDGKLDTFIFKVEAYGNFREWHPTLKKSDKYQKWLAGIKDGFCDIMQFQRYFVNSYQIPSQSGHDDSKQFYLPQLDGFDNVVRDNGKVKTCVGAGRAIMTVGRSSMEKPWLARRVFSVDRSIMVEPKREIITPYMPDEYSDRLMKRREIYNLERQKLELGKKYGRKK